MTTKTMVQRFKDGDSITDDEVEVLICIYTPLELSLKLLGPIYHLTWKEVMNDLKRLRDISTARRNKSNINNIILPKPI